MRAAAARVAVGGAVDTHRAVCVRVIKGSVVWQLRAEVCPPACGEGGGGPETELCGMFHRLNLPY